MSDDQGEAIGFLLAGAGLAGADAVEEIETHAARVFLIGERAFKMKRAVRFSFLDFSTLERRRTALEAELRLNRRTAPELYLRVLPVTRTGDRTLRLGGEGEVIEWVLEMARFDQDQLLERVAERGELDEALIDRLARAIVTFHDRAPILRERGGAGAIADVLGGNLGDLAGLSPDVCSEDELARLRRAWAEVLERDRNLLDRRREEGRVRHCHGDLHLANIVRLGGRPVPFDCLEFDERLASTDTLYDLAFLLMDLIYRGLDGAARLLLDSYLELGPDDEGAVLLPLFLSCRAAIRAKTKGFEARSDDDPAARKAARSEARRYFALTLELLSPRPACLLAIGGLSGTGKSSLARRLAEGLGPAPGAHLLRSDRLRKRLHAVEPTTRLGPEAYRREVSSQVYGMMNARAAALLGAGRAVIADAVFADPEERAAIETAAREAGVPFLGIWLDAPPDLLEARVAGRTADASDATVEVVRRQRAMETGAVQWLRLDASRSLDASEACVRRRLEAVFASR